MQADLSLKQAHVSEGTLCHVVTQHSLTACLTCFILEYFQDYWNLYGVHPVYMNIEDESGNSHAVLLHNSNAMGEFDITLKLCYTVSYLSAFKGIRLVGFWQSFKRETTFVTSRLHCFMLSFLKRGLL